MKQGKHVWMVGLIAFVCLIPQMVVPSTVRAEDDKGVDVRVKPGADVERMARTLLGQDTSGLDALTKQVEALDAATLERLIHAVRRRAHVVRPPEAPTATPAPEDRDLVLIEAQIIEARRDTLAQALGTLRPTAQHRVHPLPEEAVELLLRALEKNKLGKSLAAPSIMTFDGQTATVSVTSQVSYVQDYIVTRSGNQSVADPVIGVVKEGLHLEMHPVLSKDGKFVTIQFDGIWTDLKRPIAEMALTDLLPSSVPQARGPKVSVQLPELTMNRTKTSLTLPSGGVALVGGDRLFERDGVAYQRVVIVRATRVDPAAAQEKRGQPK